MEQLRAAASEVARRILPSERPNSRLFLDLVELIMTGARVLSPEWEVSTITLGALGVPGKRII
jgi:hypothetical protein